MGLSHFSLQAQSPDSGPAFAVASIKSSTFDENGYVRWFPGGRLRAEHVPLRFLIRFAYDLSDDRIAAGPKWVSDNLFDIEATPGEPLPADPKNDNSPHRLMLRHLIGERFHLRCHFETRALRVLVLSIAKGRPKLVPCSPDRTLHLDVKNNGSDHSFVFEGAPSSWIARNLSGLLKKTVLDHTGLTAHYDGKLEWNSDMGDGTFLYARNEPLGPGASDPSLPSIYDALQQQLGLRLRIETTSVDVLVLDGVEKPDPN